MEQYNRAYRDPRSPLTPLTPLTTKTFNFETSSLNSPYTPKVAPFTGLVQRSKQMQIHQHGTSQHEHQQQQQHYHLLPTPKYLRKKFRKLRDVYESKRGQKPSSSPLPDVITPVPVPRLEVQSCCGYVASPKNEDTIKNKQDQHFKSASPVAPRMLSPRVRSLLHKIKLDHLSSLFCRQEIDSDVLSMMSLEDLKSVGIKKPRELHQLTNAIKYAKEMFR